MPKHIELTLDGHTYLLALGRSDGQVTLRTTLDGEPLSETSAEVHEDLPWILVRSGGRVYRCAVATDGHGVWVSVDGRSLFLEKVSERSRTAGSSEAASAEVRAPMTGTIIKILVAPGDRVATGDQVAVMEAMKMEYRLEAQMDGTVECVEATEGQLLDVGALIVKLTPAEPA
jgi:biotin carboxyl carrier protein